MILYEIKKTCASLLKPWSNFRLRCANRWFMDIGIGYSNLVLCSICYYVSRIFLGMSYAYLLCSKKVYLSRSHFIHYCVVFYFAFSIWYICQRYIWYTLVMHYISNSLDPNWYKNYLFVKIDKLTYCWNNSGKGRSLENNQTKINKWKLQTSFIASHAPSTDYSGILFSTLEVLESLISRIRKNITTPKWKSGRLLLNSNKAHKETIVLS